MALKSNRDTLLLILFIMVTPMAFTGCWDQMPFGKISFNLEVGVEYSEDKKYQITRSSPVFEERIQEKTETFIVKADSMRQSREETKKMSPNLTAGGKIQHVLFSKELAQDGIKELLEVFERDPSVPNQSMIVVVDGSPKELLKTAEAFKDKPSPGYYMSRLIDNNITASHIPSTRIYRFNIDYFSPGIDPIVPMIKTADEENQAVKVIGSALFSKDRMVGELDTARTALLLAMMSKMKTNEYHLSLTPVKGDAEADAIDASILLSNTARKIAINRKKNKAMVVDINIHFQGEIDEYEWDELDNANIQKTIEKEIASKLKRECEKILKYTQEVGSDPIGIGNIVRAKHDAYWESVKWDEAYKDIVFKVDVTVDIKQFGVIK